MWKTLGNHLTLETSFGKICDAYIGLAINFITYNLPYAHSTRKAKRRLPRFCTLVCLMISPEYCTADYRADTESVNQILLLIKRKSVQVFQSEKQIAPMKRKGFT